jgi:membrane fusion protein (multidrug efflux system)
LITGPQFGLWDTAKNDIQCAATPQGAGMGKAFGIIVILLAAAAGGYYAMKGNPFATSADAQADGATGGGQGQRGGGRGQGSGGGSQGGTRREGGSGQGRAVPVEVAVARKATATDDLWAVGSLRSDESVQISSELTGRIAEITFREGDQVKEGQVLVKLDDALATAEVADAKARLDLAQANFERAQSLSRTGSGTDRALDEATSGLGIAKAAAQLAETRLAKLSITAPFNGRVGLRDVSVGAYATPGAPLVNLEKIDQLKLDFRLPETVLSSVSVGQEVEVRVDAFRDKTFSGEVYAIDPQVDVNGRSLRIRARMPNPELVLRPGLFARVLIKGLEEREVVRIPESAVVPSGGDRLVFSIVGGRAKENKVTTGRRRAGEVEVLTGIEEGTQVVVSGQGRLRDGTAVEVIGVPIGTADRS